MIRTVCVVLITSTNMLHLDNATIRREKFAYSQQFG